MGYGFLLGLVMVAVPGMFGAAGWTALFAIFTIQLAFGAVLIQRRMGLPHAAGAVALASAVSLVITAFGIAGVAWPELLLAHWDLALATLAGAPTLFLIESKRHPAEWRRWRGHQEGCSTLDVLVYRHIPDWRSR